MGRIGAPGRPTSLGRGDGGGEGKARVERVLEPVVAARTVYLCVDRLAAFMKGVDTAHALEVALEAP